MPGFKAPNFNERNAAALKAKQDALEKLRAKPTLDPAVIAERQAAQAAREEAAAEKSRARKAAIEEAKAAKKAEAERKAQEAAEAEQAAAKPALSEEELKARRDARYAARKARKK